MLTLRPSKLDKFLETLSRLGSLILTLLFLIDFFDNSFSRLRTLSFSLIIFKASSNASSLPIKSLACPGEIS